MALEAAALTGAMDYLRAEGFIGLPVHDSLIVSRSARGAVLRGLQGAFRYFAKTVVRVEVVREVVAEDVAEPIQIAGR